MKKAWYLPVSSLENAPIAYVRRTIIELNHLIAARFVDLARSNISRKGSFNVALSGGNTPQGLYTLLASSPYKNQILWEQVNIYQTDERFVPLKHPDNNYNMIKRTLINPLASMPPVSCYIKTEDISIRNAVAHYETQLKDLLPHDKLGCPQFDLILLGIGVDGHVASLFPQSDALLESKKLVVGVFAEHLNSWRISLTLKILNQTKCIIFFVVGENKASMVKTAFQSCAEKIYPMQLIKSEGQIEWYLDSLAASHLPVEAD